MLKLTVAPLALVRVDHTLHKLNQSKSSDECRISDVDIEREATTTDYVAQAESGVCSFHYLEVVTESEALAAQSIELTFDEQQVLGGGLSQGMIEEVYMSRTKNG